MKRRPDDDDPLREEEREAGLTAWLVLAVWLIVLFAFALKDP